MGRIKVNKTLVLEDLPENFRLSIIKLMSDFNIADLNKAFTQAAILLDSNLKFFKEEVNREGEKRYKSRHISELNKARETIQKGGYNLGFNNGYTRGMNEYKITFPCSKCGSEAVVTPNSECHKKILEYLRGGGWGHAQCN